MHPVILNYWKKQQMNTNLEKENQHVRTINYQKTLQPHG